ncbi:5'-AMP-activated protein kinase subunit beta-2-like [Babylonia areolata]|uniref:5'-AMP-activated protein kinase subunit beta-2-like n=1 Tax=Babylonia areolata TaxID=304850 RepID=UPI003FD3CCE7
MGNQSVKSRQISGDDTAPTVMTRFGDTSGTFDDEQGEQDPLLHGRKRASTLTPHKSSQQLGVPKLLPTVFKWQDGGKEVAVAGTFNGWKGTIPLVKSKTDFYTIVDLPEGEHEYKFCVDGQWVVNPKEPSAPNGLGSTNNKVLVKKSDFEVFEALALDSLHANKPKTPEGAVTPSDGYTQEIPARRTDGKHPGPPFLPPQLQQMMLNKETPAHCEPSLLPEPNHVMLNHLYALSIKDGVMVLSATHRFRRKFVTTLLYKPI